MKLEPKSIFQQRATKTIWSQSPVKKKRSKKLKNVFWKYKMKWWEQICFPIPVHFDEAAHLTYHLINVFSLRRQSNIVTEEVSIPSKLHNSLLFGRRKLLQSVKDDCGGVTIKFPPQDKASDKVRLSYYITRSINRSFNSFYSFIVYRSWFVVHLKTLPKRNNSF